MKKLFVLLIGLMAVASVYAQYSNSSDTPFSQGKAYVGASLSGTDLSYSGLEKGHLGIQGKVGYFLADNLMGTAQLEYTKNTDVPYAMALGAGGRYYIQQNGLYLGASVLYKHSATFDELGDKCNFDDFMPSIQVGYAFFLNRSVTIEPEIYYEQSFKNHKDYSTIGLRIGIGVYLFKDAYKKILNP